MESNDLRNAGLKVTHPRVRILEILETLKGKHVTAEDIYRQLLAGSKVELIEGHKGLVGQGISAECLPNSRLRASCSSTISKAARRFMSSTVATTTIT